MVDAERALLMLLVLATSPVWATNITLATNHTESPAAEDDWTTRPELLNRLRDLLELCTASAPPSTANRSANASAPPPALRAARTAKLEATNSTNSSWSAWESHEVVGGGGAGGGVMQSPGETEEAAAAAGGSAEAALAFDLGLCTPTAHRAPDGDSGVGTGAGGRRQGSGGRKGRRHSGRVMHNGHAYAEEDQPFSDGSRRGFSGFNHGNTERSGSSSSPHPNGSYDGRYRASSDDVGNARNAQRSSKYQFDSGSYDGGWGGSRGGGGGGGGQWGGGGSDYHHGGSFGGNGDRDVGFRGGGGFGSGGDSGYSSHGSGFSDSSFGGDGYGGGNYGSPYGNRGYPGSGQGGRNGFSEYGGRGNRNRGFDNADWGGSGSRRRGNGWSSSRDSSYGSGGRRGSRRHGYNDDDYGDDSQEDENSEYDEDSEEDDSGGNSKNGGNGKGGGPGFHRGDRNGNSHRGDRRHGSRGRNNRRNQDWRDGRDLLAATDPDAVQDDEGVAGGDRGRRARKPRSALSRSKQHGRPCAVKCALTHLGVVDAQGFPCEAATRRLLLRLLGSQAGAQAARAVTRCLLYLSAAVDEDPCEVADRLLECLLIDVDALLRVSEAVATTQPPL